MMATNAILKPSADGIIWVDFATTHVAPAAPKQVFDVGEVKEKGTEDPDLISTPALLAIAKQPTNSTDCEFLSTPSPAFLATAKQTSDKVSTAALIAAMSEASGKVSTVAPVASGNQSRAICVPTIRKRSRNENSLN